MEDRHTFRVEATDHNDMYAVTKTGGGSCAVGVSPTAALALFVRRALSSAKYNMGADELQTVVRAWAIENGVTL